tara:strand:+ start:187 stop:498 length:312 start_codon:yes stop_codon:yes gene_type:complete
MTKETTQIEAAIEAVKEWPEYEAIGDHYQRKEAYSILCKHSVAILDALQSAQTCKEPAPRNEHIEELEEALRELPEIGFYGLDIHHGIIEAAKAYAANMEDKS